MNVHSHDASRTYAREERSAMPADIGSRHDHIIDAARTCFARRGFHQATMQDICAAAGLSPGSLYRYFRGKDDLIAALVERDRAESLALIDTVRETDDILTALGDLADASLASFDDPQECALSIEIAAEAVRNPRVGALVRRYTDGVADALTAVISAAQRREQIDPALDPRALARTLLALIDGLIVQKSLDPDLDIRAYGVFYRALLAKLPRRDDASATDR